VKPVRLVESIAENFGQRLVDAKRAGATTFLSTPDGFLYAFIEEPSHLTAKYLETLKEKGLADFKHIVILSSGSLTPESLQILNDPKVSIVTGERFTFLVHAMGLESASAPPAPAPVGQSALPTAQKLDKLMHLGKEWIDMGVPALAARFYGEAAKLKPEYVPAYLGVGEAYLALGFGDMAQQAFDTVLTLQEGNMQARVGKARLHGLLGRIKQEIEELGKLLKETPGSTVVRAHLLAALVEARKWDEAITHIDELLKIAPNEGRFHAMKAACLMHLREKEAAIREESMAVQLGMPIEELEKVYFTMRLPPKPIHSVPRPGHEEKAPVKQPEPVQEWRKRR
jgi:tetratricopeptide (TPR) repeat protein